MRLFGRRAGGPVESSRHRVVRSGCAVLLVLSLVANAWMWWGGRDRIGQWRSAEGLRTYNAAYDEVLDAMSPAQTRDVPTSFGTARSYLFLPESPQARAAVPIVLLPGWGAGSPMWSENLPGLVTERPVWAFDAVGDAGKSVQSAPIRTPADQAQWVAETFAGLGIARAHVVGHSFGGWLATNLALHRPDLVVGLSLLEPVQVVTGLRWQIYLMSIPTSLPFLPQSWRDGALATIGGADSIDPSDPMTAMIAAGTAEYTPRRSFPSRPSADQLATLSMPVYVAMGSASAVNSDPAGALRTAAETIPDVTTQLWDGAGHSLPMERIDPVNRALLDFMADAER